MQQTITFIHSAYPEPHNLCELSWSGRLDHKGQLWFDLHLISEDYDAHSDDLDYDNEDDDTDEEFTSLHYWEDRDVWRNYHRCILSSTYWSEAKGFLVNSVQEGGDLLFDFNQLGGKTYHLDTAPLANEAISAFSLYLLGHDACKNHTIRFRQQENGKFHILWQGLIALFYSGFTEFQHSFIADLPDVTFDGFYFPREWSLVQAEIMFKRVLADVDHYQFVPLELNAQQPQYKLVRI